MEKGLMFFYDAEADVLYVSKGEPAANSESEEIGDDVIVRWDVTTNEVVGFTILNFSKRFQDTKVPQSIPLAVSFALRGEI